MRLKVLPDGRTRIRRPCRLLRRPRRTGRCRGSRKRRVVERRGVLVPELVGHQVSVGHERDGFEPEVGAYGREIAGQFQSWVASQSARGAGVKAQDLRRLTVLALLSRWSRRRSRVSRARLWRSPPVGRALPVGVAQRLAAAPSAFGRGCPDGAVPNELVQRRGAILNGPSVAAFEPVAGS